LGQRPKPRFAIKHYEEKRHALAKRARGRRLEIYVTDEEYATIRSNMEKAGTKNLSAYARKMLCEGCIKVVDYSALRELSAHLGEMARNIHQIAKRANQTFSLHDSDYERIHKAYYEDWAEMKALISKEIASSRK